MSTVSQPLPQHRRYAACMHTMIVAARRLAIASTCLANANVLAVERFQHLVQALQIARAGCTVVAAPLTLAAAGVASVRASVIAVHLEGCSAWPLHCTNS